MLHKTIFDCVSVCIYVHMQVQVPAEARVGHLVPRAELQAAVST